MLNKLFVACLSGFESSKLPTPGEFRETTNHLAAIILKQMQKSQRHTPPSVILRQMMIYNTKTWRSFALQMSQFLSCISVVELAFKASSQ